MKNVRALLTGFCALVALSLVSAGAVGESGNVSGSARVANEKPVNLHVALSGDQDPSSPGTQLSPGSGGTSITATGRAEDGNGWQDLRHSEFHVYRPDGSLLAGPIAGEPAHQGSGRLREFSATFTVGSGEPTGTYTVAVVVKDRHEEPGNANTTFELLPTLALAVDTGSITFGDGALGPGVSTHATPSAISVRNAGNVRLDLRISSDGLSTPSGDATIGPERLNYSPFADMSSERPLSSGGITDDAFDLEPGASRSAYIDLHMPTGDEQYVPADTYSGSIVLGGVSG